MPLIRLTLGAGLALALALLLETFVRLPWALTLFNPAAAPFWAIGGALLAAAWRPKGAL